MSRGQLTLITGGARSGKSSYAQELARQAGGAVSYVATAQALDAEFTRRIARHRRDRPASWVTIEAPYDLRRALEQAWREAAVVLVDDLGLWASNWLLLDCGDPEAPGWLEALEQLEDRLTADALALVAGIPAGGRLLVVTQETGWGLVPPYPLGRAFRDLLGRLNQRLAREAEEVYLLVTGLPIDVKRLARES